MPDYAAVWLGPSDAKGGRRVQGLGACVPAHGRCRFTAGEDTAQHELAIMGWTTKALTTNVVMEADIEEALEAFKKWEPFR